MNAVSQSNQVAPVASPVAASCRSRKWSRRLAGILSLGALLLVAWLFRAPLLTSLANAWIINDPLQKADAIVVLGGKPELRAPEAARLYCQGLAPRILYMDVKVNPAVELGIIPSEGEITRRLLLSNNVPETAIAVVGHQVATTYDESLAVRAWLATNAARTIVIATDLSHTRRARWIFRKELKTTGAQVAVHAIQPEEYGATNWWKCEAGFIAFQNEFLKSIYYHLKY